jgi:uncharacterized glyoxalase superfamily protein PhnB
MKVTNITLWVQDNKLSDKFYKKLGFEVASSDSDVSTVTLDGFSLVLVTMRDEEMFAKDSMSGEKGQGMYLYLCVESTDKVYDDLKRKGIKPATEPRDWEWGNREFIVKDLDGYKLCFWEPIKG